MRASPPPFDPAAAPPAPDYAGPANWASLPSIRDDGDMTPKGVPEPPQLRAPVDVFFIHSDVPLRSAVWNADTRDVWFNGDVGQTTIRNQASAFNGCCAIYAPRYRQANPAFTSGDGSGAFDLAYSDILRAFREFRRRVGDRPFIVAGHGGGARLGRLLIEREIDGQPIAARMVAAYLIGDPLPLDWFDARGTVRHCAGESDTGCVVAWSIRIEGTKPSANRAACNNPLSWTTGPALAPRTAHRGAWMRNGYEFPEPLRAPDAGLITARCGADGMLYVSPPGEPHASRMAPGGSNGALDYQLVYMDLRHNAAARVAAFLARR
ncbi:DUF3089 domain-containing protein [Sphingomonas sp. ST-64]|uniref:DUF3089 domain-containing protein n=1 Tax=Sphingomonas plantiphila TaxID=3163295 RepID=A0ABW8YL36_9SPHN